MPKVFLTLFCQCYAIAAIITMLCFSRKIENKKRDVVFFHFISLISQKLLAIEV